MARNAGDKRRERIPSISEVAMGFASSIGRKDVRYNNFWNYRPIPKLMTEDGFFASPKPTKGIFGANRSTKTWASTYETVIVFTGIIPPAMQGLYAHEEELKKISSGPHKRARKCRIIVQSKKHYADTIEPILLGADGLLPEAWSDFDASVDMFRGPDGSFLEIMPIDPRERVAEKTANTLRGGDIDHTQIDEITAEPAYTESIVRAAAKADGPKTVTNAFCPQEGFECWTYETFYEACYELVSKQTRRKPPERCHPDVYSVQVSMRDNPSISAESIDSQIRRLKEWEVAFRVHGEYSNRAANPFFDMDILVGWETEERCKDGEPYKIWQKSVDVEKGVFRGELMKQREGSFDESLEPIWRVWELPVDGEKYIVTVDPAEGAPNSDPSAIGVWRCTVPSMPKQVAQLRMRKIKPGTTAIQAACIGNVYGGGGNRYALLVPERNNHAGGVVCDRVRKYKNIYKRVRSEKQLDIQTDTIGWYTDSRSKSPMLSDGYEMLSEMAAMKIPLAGGEFQNYCPVNSLLTLRELQSYEERLRISRDTKIKKMEWGARAGTHDDTVMEMMIAFRIMKNEYNKIKACKITGGMVGPYQDQYSDQPDRKTGRRAFGGMKQKKSLTELRRGTSHAKRR